jgi:hypothetical protein
MGVVIEICVKHPGGPTRNRGTDITYYTYFTAELSRSETVTNL